jgi:hypothetical protein
LLSPRGRIPQLRKEVLSTGGFVWRLASDRPTPAFLFHLFISQPLLQRWGLCFFGHFPVTEVGATKADAPRKGATKADEPLSSTHSPVMVFGSPSPTIRRDATEVAPGGIPDSPRSGAAKKIQAPSPPVLDLVPGLKELRADWEFPRTSIYIHLATEREPTKKHPSVGIYGAAQGRCRFAGRSKGRVF